VRRAPWFRRWLDLDYGLTPTPHAEAQRTQRTVEEFSATERLRRRAAHLERKVLTPAQVARSFHKIANEGSGRGRAVQSLPVVVLVPVRCCMPPTRTTWWRSPPSFRQRSRRAQRIGVLGRGIFSPCSVASDFLFNRRLAALCSATEFGVIDADRLGVITLVQALARADHAAALANGLSGHTLPPIQGRICTCTFADYVHSHKHGHTADNHDTPTRRRAGRPQAEA
jgi:hypothetical protein